MSLVSEALKKAQREAAAREARDKGLPPPLTANASQPFRARRRRTPATWAALALAALLVGAGLGVLLWNRAGQGAAATGGGREEEAPERTAPAADAVAAAAQPEVSRAPATAVPSSGEAAPAAPLATTAWSAPVAVATPVRTATAAAPSTPSMEASASAPATAAATPSPASRQVAATAPPTVPPPAAAAKRGAATFVREATLADGTRLHLGGIAYSDAAPLAYLNGKLVGTGEHVEGCRVARIERGQVSLDCGGVATILTLK